MNATHKDEGFRPSYLKISIASECKTVIGKSEFIWVPLYNGEWSLVDDHKKEIIVRPADSGFTADLYLYGKILVKIIPEPLSFDECIVICESFAREKLRTGYANYNNEVLKEWKTLKPTEVQIDLLAFHGIATDKLNKLQASILIRLILGLDRQSRRDKKRRKSGDTTLENSWT